jgi:hypothetical protein
MFSALQFAFAAAALIPHAEPPKISSYAPRLEYRVEDVVDKPERYLESKEDVEKTIRFWNQLGNDGWELVASPCYNCFGVTGVGALHMPIYEYFKRFDDANLRGKWEYKIINVSNQVPQDRKGKIEVGKTLVKESSNGWELCAAYVKSFEDPRDERTFFVLKKQKDFKGAPGVEYRIVYVGENPERFLLTTEDRKKAIRAWDQLGDEGWELAATACYSIHGLGQESSAMPIPVYEFYTRFKDTGLRKK